MPIDARIPLGIVPPKIDSPQQVAGSLAQLANLQGEAQERQMRVQALQQAQSDRDAMRAALKDSNGDLRVAAQNVLSINPELGATLLSHANAADKAKLDLETAKIGHDLNVVNFTAQLVGGPLSAKDPAQAEQAWDAMLAQMQHAGLSTEGLPENFDPGVAQRLNDQALTARDRLAARQKEIDDARMAAQAAAAAKDKADDNKRADAAANETAWYHRQTLAQDASGAKEPLVPIIGPDGKPVLVRRSQAEGKTPASSREQGRPVTSGDAGRMADFDTSISDLAILKKTLTETKGATGTGAAIGAGMPAWVTDLTGAGIDAKKRQGVIDRVKQVIGKTLEGGVLRKEDEVKYEKILPTIKDTAEVAEAKLEGLATAIKQRRSTFLDSLADAGYDTGRFESRAAGAGTGTGPRIGEERTINGQRGRWDGEGWLPVGAK